jgi:hypothetical protein
MTNRRAVRDAVNRVAARFETLLLALHQSARQQYRTDHEDAAAQDGRNHMSLLLIFLDVYRAKVSHVFGLLRREKWVREQNQSDNRENCA